MAIDRIVSMLLRAAELAFAAVVAGVTGNYLEKSHASAWSLGRFIYAEVVAGLSLFFALVWLFPFAGSFIHWPLDFILSACWWAVFGLLVNLVGGSCGHIFNWANVHPGGNQCGQFKSDIAFSFLSAVLWLASALIGLFWVRRRERAAARAEAAHASRRPWYRRSRI